MFLFLKCRFRVFYLFLLNYYAWGDWYNYILIANPGNVIRGGELGKNLEILNFSRYYPIPVELQYLFGKRPER